MSETVLERIRSKAKALNRKICLTESDDIRNLQAAAKLTQTGYAQPILVGNAEAILKLARDNRIALDGVELADVLKHPRLNDYIAKLVELRQAKGLTEIQARAWIKDTCVFAAAMVCAGDAHGYVSGGGNSKGYNHDTASKTRPALQLFKTAPGIKIASSYFIMQMCDPRWGFNGALFYADCGLNINPTADQLAEIAVTTARTYQTLTGDEPRVGMISCSTKGSAKDPIVDKVIAATAKAQQLAPELKIDGEFQFDAAVIPEVAAKKAPLSAIAGRCNVLIFPDLNCGNTMYKATERLAGAIAIGPLVQGLRRPFNDVSRGCSANDIVDCAAVAAITEWSE
ncbi:MAG: phosphate acetyltransferase [Kiritimatiellaeota bacterium]|nr:phosphate acetyltransferase [Kiritimatiellota bacterium]